MHDNEMPPMLQRFDRRERTTGGKCRPWFSPEGRWGADFLLAPILLCLNDLPSAKWIRGPSRTISE
jgi:hypothetical protein